MKKIVLHVHRAKKTHDGRRLVQTFTAGTVAIKVYYDSDLAEYCCELYKAGIHYEPADYFTDDKADALASAQDMLRRSKTQDAVSEEQVKVYIKTRRESDMLGNEIESLQKKNQFVPQSLRDKFRASSQAENGFSNEVKQAARARGLKIFDTSFPHTVLWRGFQWSKTGKEGTNMKSGEESAEYRRINKSDSDRSDVRMWRTASGTMAEDSAMARDGNIFASPAMQESNRLIAQINNARIHTLRADNVMEAEEALSDIAFIEGRIQALKAALTKVG